MIPGESRSLALVKTCHMAKNSKWQLFRAHQVPRKRCMRAHKLASLELARWLREKQLPCYFGSPCVPLSACQAPCRGHQVSWSTCVPLSACQVSQLPCVGPLGVKATTYPLSACRVSRSSSVPCWPARCHGCHVSIPGVADAMCLFSANHVSRPLCVSLSDCQVSRLPCVVPPGVKASMCRSTRCQGHHVSVHQVS
jgi:hypothetical protein